MPLLPGDVLRVQVTTRNAVLVRVLFTLDSKRPPFNHDPDNWGLDKFVLIQAGKVKATLSKSFEPDNLILPGHLVLQFQVSKRSGISREGLCPPTIDDIEFPSYLERHNDMVYFCRGHLRIRLADVSQEEMHSELDVRQSWIHADQLGYAIGQHQRYEKSGRVLNPNSHPIIASGDLRYHWNRKQILARLKMDVSEPFPELIKKDDALVKAYTLLLAR